ncbi:MAG: beta-ketoacyl-[acyl-carrier-protein] synthase family protein [Candidatus Schekmanbacteria bacterium]|nr:beta-ketoacyl-[acyl-carrier-protein] synthase family protein [Candidatus Schekmanbacteria bacterium]
MSSDESGERRVVVTGMGVISPYGRGLAPFREALFAGRSAVGRIRRFSAAGLPVDFAAELDLAVLRGAFPDPIDRARDPCALAAILAASDALRDAGLAAPGEARDGAAVIVGSGFGSQLATAGGYADFYERHRERAHPLTVVRSMHNAVSSSLSIELGLRGENLTIAAACASAASAMGLAFQRIRSGLDDIVVTGGSDVYVHEAILRAWIALRVLARHEDPARASRPFDRDHNGLVLGEGAAMLVFEALPRARRRGAPILAEVIGFGATSDAQHLTAPSAAGQAAAIKAALRSARLAPTDVGYINAHGTSTPLNDRVETAAIKLAMGDVAGRTPVSSTKSLIGHTMGASGALEAVATILGLQQGVIFGTYNYERADPECDLDVVPNETRDAAVAIALSSSFGFGGANAVLAFRRRNECHG